MTQPGERFVGQPARGPDRMSAPRAHASPIGAVSRRRFLGLSVLGAASIGLAGCTMTVPPRPSPTPTVAPATTDADLSIGVVLSLTGRFSREGALIRAGYEVWQDAVQQAGGLKLGSARRTVRLVFADDESDPLTAGRQAERLSSNEKVRLWLGPYSTAITTAVATVTDRAGGVLVAPDASASSLFRRGLKGLLSIQAPDERLFHGLADLAATAQPRAQPVGFLIADEPSNAAAAAGFRERAAALDLGPIRLELTGLGSIDVTAPLERIAALGPRLMILATEPGQTAQFTPAVRDLVPFAAMRALVPLPEPPTASSHRELIYDGALTVDTWSPTIAASGPVLGSARDFVERFKRLHGYPVDARGASAAAAGLALQLAVEQAGSAEPAAVREAFAALDVMTFWGRLAWDAAGRNRAAVPPVLQQQGETLVAVYPAELAGGKLRYPLAGWPRS
jgi:branched-chain amino acid transport system substrate-binding protein